MLAWLWCLTLGAVTVFFIRYHLKRKKLYSLANSLKGLPTLPILGNALLFLGKEDELFERMSHMINCHDSPSRFWLGPKLIIILKKAPEMEKVLTSSKCNNKDDIYMLLSVFNGISLFTSNGSAWKKQRRFIAPFLGHKYMESYFEAINDAAIVLMEKLEERVDKETFNVEPLLNRCYHDIVGGEFIFFKITSFRYDLFIILEFLIGFKPEAQNGKMEELIRKTRRIYTLIHSRMLKLWLHPDFLFRLSDNGKQQLRFKEAFHKFVSKGMSLIEIQRNGKEGVSSKTVSILEQLMAAKESNPEFYADQNLFDHITTLYSAAEDTATSICSYLFVLLGMYPKIQDRLVQEMRNAFETPFKKMEYKDLLKLKYLDMCVKEVIRLFPIGPYILRKVTEDFQWGNRVFPKDCTLLLSFYNIHRDPEYWQKPNEFYPEHFLPETVANRHPYAFLPFSSGARSCPGELIAYTAIKTVAGTILQHFVFEADGTLQNIKVKADISIRPVGGHMLRVKKRIC